MKEHELLHLASLLHDIGKFRRRATFDNDKTHQEHSHAFVTEDFSDYFAPCGDTFKNAIRHHHNDPIQLQDPIEKQVILADRLSATEHVTEGTVEEDFTDAALISILSRLNKDTDREAYRYSLTELDFEKRETVIPTETADVNRDTYEQLWEKFKEAFGKATEGKQYAPADYQTIVALLHKYISRIPSGQTEDNPDSDISLYDHLRTTAAIAACIGRELTDETDVDEELKLLNDNKDGRGDNKDGRGDNKDGRGDLAPTKESQRNICALIKGDISGIQKFLYHILSDGASNQLRGRSFYLQLLTEAIAHWVLRQLELPITNLLLAGGGHFFILAPHTDTQNRFDTLRQKISQKLWTLHKGELYCILDYVPVSAEDFEAENFSDRWRAVSENIHQRKQKKWSEIEAQEMFDNLFEPKEDREVNWLFEDLGRDLRHATTLVTFEIPESPIPDKPIWRDTIKTFGLDIAICADTDQTPERPTQAEHAIVYQLGDTELLSNTEKYQWEGIPVCYDFRIFQPVIPRRQDRTDPAAVADYDYLANASEGVDWFGALRMDVDNLGTVFTEKVENATISRLATLSEALRLFFEGYVPELCRQYNKGHDKEILELIYAGGDDLFLVGGWSALPDIAEQIRTEFRHFVTGDHITLSGGMAIEHKKFPLYQFADISGDAEDAAKSLRRKNADGEVIEKDAISFLRKPMSWENFVEVRNWHEKFMKVLTNEKPLPRDILTRLSQIYADKRRWAWRSIYYFHRLLERNKSQETFIRELRNELNHNDTFDLKGFIQVITRWTALRIRK